MIFQEVPDYGPLWRCPAAVLTEETKTVMTIYNQCRNFETFPSGKGYYHVKPRANGILPVAGGVLDQSATLMDAFAILDNVIAQVEKRG